MDRLIQMMNEIQRALVDVKLQCTINLPRIAVIGSQSSGKSSVLESIVGEDFLPRGTGIVTRCPLVLKLIHNKEGKKYALFDHLDQTIIEDFEEVRNEIIQRTTELAGSETRIVNKPISLTINSPEVPNLTLIDLPGFTKVNMDDQSGDISKEIEDLVMEYIQEENTIILAISPANADIATSDALLYAKKVDPNRDRTFGVMTKIDIMDKGTDACDYLSGKQYKLKHGYIGVKCRSQDDNNRNKTIKQALEEERSFFETHPAYKDFAETQGTAMLAKKLSELLGDHIKGLLPGVEKLILKNSKEFASILEDLGPVVVCKNEYDAQEYLIKTIEEYCNSYQDMVYGNSSISSDNSYNGGSKIYQIFKFFADKKISKIDPMKGLTEENILVEVRKALGIESGLFLPEEACRNLIRKSIDLFMQPCLKCSELVYKELDETITAAMGPGLVSRNSLRNFLRDTMEKLIEENLSILNDFITHRIE